MMARLRDSFEPRAEPVRPRAPAVRPTPRDDFRTANPAVFGRTGGDAETIRRVAAIEARAAQLKERMRDHFCVHEDRWVRDEAACIMQKRSAPHLSLVPKSGIRRQGGDTVQQQARRQVQARMTRRLTALNAAKLRLQNGVIRSGPRQQQRMNNGPSPRRKGPHNSQSQ